ncbi:MAG: biotin--[acetyl-CoA-carboxylase] ligase [Bacteroidales bacterium]|nr:biotin--[acetyl-CoA-carboxylase] ligase [Bacteroidales bacterium]MBN2748823.1 biotin--[acetyl-CoA-carboxylase] ligase [Bacteroidales bacterium]
MLNFKVEWLESVGSTNDLAFAQGARGAAEGAVFAAVSQTEGRGQRGNYWESEPGDNLTFSLVLRPEFLPVHNQFLLSMAVALGVCDWLKSHGVPATIKWPNDIYVGNSKLGGILIENSISGSSFGFSVVGIGVNVNQSRFSADLPNPASLKLLTSRGYELPAELDTLLNLLAVRYDTLKRGNTTALVASYMESLYRKSDWFRYCDTTGVFEARIKLVKPSGELVLELADGSIREYLFKEVSFVI